MPLYTQQPNPSGTWQDSAGRRFEIINANKDKETFGGGLATLKMDGRAALRTKPWATADSEFEFAQTVGLSLVSPSASSPGVASAISYSNAASLIVATNVQAAIDEVEGRVDSLESAPGGPVFGGAAAGANGSSGAVPAPLSGEESYILQGDGTWVDPLDAVPASGLTDNGDGTYAWDDGRGNSTTINPTSADESEVSTAALTGNLSGLAVGSSVQDALVILDSIDLDTSSFLDNGDGTYTHDNGQGSSFTIDTNAASAVVDATGFSGNLSATDTDVQTALATIDALVLGSGAVFGPADGTTAGTVGDVPAPAATDNTKFLRGDGTWQDVSVGATPDFVGTDGTSNGTAGLVPEPQVGDENKVLTGDGNWSDIATGTVGVTFTSAQFVPAGADSVLSIPFATTGITDVGLVQVRDNAGDVTYPVVNVAINGDISLTVSGGAEFDGTAFVFENINTVAL